jgi:hypothetical protein
MAGDPCGCTVLVPKAGHTATKTYGADSGSPTGFRKQSDYDLGWEFAAHEARLEDLDALAGLAAGLADRDGILVRGELTEAGREDRDAANRRINPKREGDRPSLRACARRWVMFDVDKLPMPEGLSVLRREDHAAIIDATIRATFHPNFWGARCFWQFSNSAGLAVTDTVKVHLFFWLSEPADDDHLRRVLKAHMPDIDHAPLNPVQPHFVTDPRVVGGRDPLAGFRTGWREGAAEAVLPALPASPPRPARKARDTTHLYDDGGPEVPRVSNLPLTGFLDDLQRTLGDGPGREGFHEPLRRATLRYAAQVAGGHTPRGDDRLVKLLLRLVAAAPTRRCRHALAATYDHAYLRRLLAGAYRIISLEQTT